jgi:hypothetical protein
VDSGSDDDDEDEDDDDDDEEGTCKLWVAVGYKSSESERRITHDTQGREKEGVRNRGHEARMLEATDVSDM